MSDEKKAEVVLPISEPAKRIGLAMEEARAADKLEEAAQAEMREVRGGLVAWANAAAQEILEDLAPHGKSVHISIVADGVRSFEGNATRSR